MNQPSHHQLEQLDGNSILGVESRPQTELHYSYKTDKRLKKNERLYLFSTEKKQKISSD